jgi:hypothetical protein
MIEDINTHKTQYSILGLYALFTFVMLFKFTNSTLRLRIILFFVLYYLVWSTIHHLIAQRLTIQLFLEYLLLAILGLVSLIVLF